MGILLPHYISLKDYLINCDVPISIILGLTIYTFINVIDILNGLSFLHEMKIVHANLKLENVLISSKAIAKISDFGLKPTEPDIYSISFIAPEILCGKLPLQASDVSFYVFIQVLFFNIYSFGMITWCIIHKTSKIFPPVDLKTLKTAIIEQNFHPHIQENIFSSIINRYILLFFNLDRSWAMIPNDRPSSKTLLKEVIMLSKINK